MKKEKAKKEADWCWLVHYPIRQVQSVLSAGSPDGIRLKVLVWMVEYLPLLSESTMACLIGFFALSQPGRLSD